MSRGVVAVVAAGDRSIWLRFARGERHGTLAPAGPARRHHADESFVEDGNRHVVGRKTSHFSYQYAVQKLERISFAELAGSDHPMIFGHADFRRGRGETRTGRRR